MSDESNSSWERASTAVVPTIVATAVVPTIVATAAAPAGRCFRTLRNTRRYRDIRIVSYVSCINVAGSQPTTISAATERVTVYIITDEQLTIDNFSVPILLLCIRYDYTIGGVRVFEFDITISNLALSSLLHPDAS
ncbi:hypothetical protein D3261_01975 [Halococcus sp. IIIV-5B]|nr:hypothetical protein D3261_01975 [Halococcus sp. IIIV-5B]